MGTNQHSLVSGDGNRGGERSAIPVGGNQDDVGEARGGRSPGKIEGGPEPEEGDLGLEVVDLGLELLLRLAGLLVTLLARPGVARAVLLAARDAPHPLRRRRRRPVLGWQHRDVDESAHGFGTRRLRARESNDLLIG